MITEPNPPLRPRIDPDDDPEWKVQNDYTFYRPLDYSSKQIRLISIAPGSVDDPLHCTLNRHTTPINEQDFEALSYCWGDLQDTVTITLRHGCTESSRADSEAQGGDDEQTFNITKSLNLALKHLRYPDRERVIWIDALCINQGSIRERNYAIPFMVDVYRCASCVVVFLGEENKKKNFTRIWQLMAMLKSAIEKALPDGGMSGPLTPQHDVHGLVDCLEFGSKDGKQEGESLFRIHLSLAAEDFFEYRWFQRVWVVQEVMNARKAIVYCGDQKRDWIDILVFFCTAVKNSRSYAGALSGSLDLRDRLPPFLWTKLLAAQRGQQKIEETTAPPHLPLLDILARSRAFAATDPRDKIFALLSFGEETHNIEALPPRLKPDYAKSSCDVWKDVTRQWIIDHQSLDILGVRHEEVDKNNQVAQKTIYVSAQNQPPLSNAQSRFIIEKPPSEHPSWALWHAEHPVSAKTALFRLGQTLPVCQVPIDVEILDKPVHSSVLSLRGIYIDRVTSVQWPFKRWNFSESDIRQFNYHTQPPTSLNDGIPIAWASLLGAVQGIGEGNPEQVKIKFPAEIQIPPYPSGKSLLQAFIEALICRRFKARFKFDGTDESLTDLVNSLSNLKLEVTETPDSEATTATPAKGVDEGSDVDAMSHFAAHWACSQCDPDMKWLPEPAAGVLRKLAKHGNSRNFTEMCEFAEGRCFFQTAKGAFGLCPQETQLDDIVVSLSGGRTPYVLRQSPTEDGTAQKQHWTLIGECYVHDLDIAKMTSEVWKKRPEAVQVFDIS
ncbi:heterokaryon incompatibility protein-domain-containing protein [Apiospora saccharicola]|uniref:Heterokaryon incompatibility protein-domain-containing protein n=1 Tax=Apiospora saccharicola TaxID=335842 RepID=A0ABR1VQ45_9PEZI